MPWLISELDAECLKSFWSAWSLLLLNLLQGAVQQRRSHHLILTRETVHFERIDPKSYKDSPVGARLHPKTVSYQANPKPWVGQRPSEWFNPTVGCQVIAMCCPSHNWHLKDIAPNVHFLKYFVNQPFSFSSLNQCLFEDTVDLYCDTVITSLSSLPSFSACWIIFLSL